MEKGKWYFSYNYTILWGGELSATGLQEVILKATTKEEAIAEAKTEWLKAIAYTKAEWEKMKVQFYGNEVWEPCIYLKVPLPVE